MALDGFDLHRFFPHLLGTVAGGWTNASSKLYLREFGIGVAEWRVLASIASLEKASSLEVVNLIAMDASAVSRSVSRLEAKKLVAPVTGKFPGRTKPFELTRAGRSLYTSMLQVALEREEILLRGLSTDERFELLRLMQKIRGNLDAL